MGPVPPGHRERWGPHRLYPTLQAMKEFHEMRAFCSGRYGSQQPGAGPSLSLHAGQSSSQLLLLVIRATQMRPLFMTRPCLHFALNAFIPFTSLESCGGLTRLITRIVGVPENSDDCQFIHQKHLAGMKASNKTLFNSQPSDSPKNLPLPSIFPSLPPLPFQRKLERGRENRVSKGQHARPRSKNIIALEHPRVRRGQPGMEQPRCGAILGPGRCSLVLPANSSQTSMGGSYPEGMAGPWRQVN